MAWARAGVIKISNCRVQCTNSSRLELLTGSRRVLAEVTSLVASNEASGLNLGSGTARESGVEVHNALHASGILSGTDGLCKMSVIA
jgi:hypothetical protein